jgi:hypothetical protein
MENDVVKKDNEKTAIKMIDRNIEEVVIRKGYALTLHHPNNVSIAGTISAPGKFILDRHEDFEKNKAYCAVKREEKQIRLILNEQNQHGHYEIIGKIKVGSKFTALGINDSSKSYSPMELSKKLKMMRSIFTSRAEHGTVVNALRQIKAKLKQDIEAKDDSRGNVSGSFEQTLESNVPENFTLELPLLEGEKKVKFKVDVWIEGNSYNDLRCYLESVDAADMIEEAVDKRIDEEIDIIKPHAVVIES